MTGDIGAAPLRAITRRLGRLSGISRVVIHRATVPALPRDESIRVLLAVVSLVLAGCSPCPVGPFGLPLNCSDSMDEDGDGVPVEEDCDDSNPQSFPGNEELICDGIDQDCDGSDEGIEIPYDGIDQSCDGEDLVDVDNDNHDAVEAGGDDCDDDDRGIHPGETEIPYDGIDQNCDGEDLTDVDGDGHDAVEAGGDDCLDTGGNVYPGAEEACDYEDNDCDGEVDEDEDEDGFPVCDDCDDTDSSVHPGASEVAEDGIDQDCDDADLGNCPAKLIFGSYTFVGAFNWTGCEQDWHWTLEEAQGYEIPQDASCNPAASWIAWEGVVYLGPGNGQIEGNLTGYYWSGGVVVDGNEFIGTGWSPKTQSCTEVLGNWHLE